MDSKYRMMNTHCTGLGLLESVFVNNLALLEKSRCYSYSHMLHDLHVWYIYLHLHAFTINLSKMWANIPYIKHLGFISIKLLQRLHCVLVSRLLIHFN